MWTLGMTIVTNDGVKFGTGVSMKMCKLKHIIYYIII